ncbi:MAG: carboxypeptidase family protein [Alphaproteobacteria bacterium]|nr:carboxypeptidase family protein [Alphaproteobacteria bacterium]
MHVSSAFDSGNIEVIDASDPDDVQLAIRWDVGQEHMQWFHFRVSGAAGVPLTLRIVNAGKTSYPTGWMGYRAVASSDRQRWRRVHTDFIDNELVIRVTPDAEPLYIAYFAPYAHERHLNLIAHCASSPLAEVRRLGASVDGLDMDAVKIGEGPLVVWAIARQHPGESMAEWWMEGFLARLSDPFCPLARQLRAKATFHVVPNMNPDGSRRGHLRTNAKGVNLNRVWHDPNMERCPEVKVVRDDMDRTGVDLCFDVHGDEELPYNFISGAEGTPSWDARRAALAKRLSDAYERANPDFQQVEGYPLDEPGAANMSMCTSQVAERYNCVALTLEQPFKDNADAPDPLWGWCPERCAALGRSALDAIAEVIDELRPKQG